MSVPVIFYRPFGSFLCRFAVLLIDKDKGIIKDM